MTVATIFMAILHKMRNLLYYFFVSKPPSVGEVLLLNVHDEAAKPSKPSCYEEGMTRLYCIINFTCLWFFVFRCDWKRYRNLAGSYHHLSVL